MKKKFKKGTDYQDMNEWIGESLVYSLTDNNELTKDIEIEIKTSELSSTKTITNMK